MCDALVLVLWRLRNSLINSITRKRTRENEERNTSSASWSSIDLQKSSLASVNDVCVCKNISIMISQKKIKNHYHSKITIAHHNVMYVCVRWLFFIKTLPKSQKWFWLKVKMRWNGKRTVNVPSKISSFHVISSFARTSNSNSISHTYAWINSCDIVGAIDRTMMSL